MVCEARGAWTWSCARSPTTSGGPSTAPSRPRFGGIPHGRAELDEWGDELAVDRTLAAFDGDEIVANAGAYTFELTVPGGARVPTAGVTVVGVRATHRRRGAPHAA